jgi:N-acetylneuraminic acid mutarotase
MGIQSTELYTYADAGGTWDDTAASCPGYFYRHTATLLPNGLVLIAGMDFGTDTYTYNVNTAAWNTAGALAIGRFWNTATLLANGKVLVSGGWDSSGGTVLASAEVFDYAAGSWSDTGSLNAGRRLRHTLTLLPNGKVLVTGGGDISSPLSAAELYDPATSIWSTTGSLAAARYAHTSTLLANGKVLVSGGCGPTFVGSALAGAELYDGANWAPAESLASARYVHTATLLANGQVLVVGGFGNSDFLTSAEVYDPTNESWAPAGNLATRRANHTATLLSNGKVLVAGGENTSGLLASAELFNPATGTWTTTPNLSISRRNHTATLLPNGKVLVAGGEGGSPSSCLNSAEIFDPAANGGDGGWTATGNLTARVYHNATLLPNGKVLVTGGYNGGTLSSAELYDPALGTWTATGSLATAREQHTSVLLANGKVLAAGGGLGVAGMKSSELFDPGLGFSGAWRPYIEPFEGTPILSPGGYLDFQGAGLRGKSEASGGATNNSSTGYPLVQVRRLDSERIFWLPPSSGSFSDTEFTSANFQDVQDGWCLITVFTNGIPSLSRFGRFAGGSPTAVELASFTAAGDKKRVVLAWETYTEKNNVGFHLWRAEAGQDAYTRLTRDLIPARGTATMGAAYSYADYAVVRGREYRYKLEDVDTKGASTFHGPVSAAAGAGKGKKK